MLPFGGGTEKAPDNECPALQTVNKPVLKNASENWLFKIANQRRFFMLITNKLPAGLSKSFLRALQKGHFHNRFDLWTLLML